MVLPSRFTTLMSILLSVARVEFTEAALAAFVRKNWPAIMYEQDCVRWAIAFAASLPASAVG